MCVCALALAAFVCASASATSPDLEARLDAGLGQPHSTTASSPASGLPLPASQLMTPQAQIHLGVDRCDADLMVQQAGSFSYTYRLHSLWRGIVEYLLPQDGVFHRGDTLARIYDPYLLPDLERARRLMTLEDVTPLTILEARGERREAGHGSDSSDNSNNGHDSNGQRPTADARGEVREAGTGVARAVQDEPQLSEPPSMRETSEARSTKLAARSSQANRREQNLLRDQARLTAKTVAAAIQARDEGRAALAKAEQELADRQYLCEEGVLAEHALEPAVQRVDELKQALEQAEEELSEAQEGYARIARRIRALEQSGIRHPTSDIRPTANDPAGPESDVRSATSEVDSPGSEVRGPGSEIEPVPLHETADEEDQAAPLPPEVRELAAPRWEEVTAPGMGLIADVMAPPGSLVEEGEELLELADVELARLTARVCQRDMPEFWTGRTVTVTFQDYPPVALEGWVASCSPTADGDDAEVEFLLLCERGPFADDAYLAVHWMTLEAGVRADAAGPQTLEPLREPDPASRTQAHLRRLFPLADPWGYLPEPSSWSDRLSSDTYAGRLRLDPMPALQEGRASSPRREAERRRLSALREWRATYIEGMSTTILEDGTALTYPREGEIGGAVRRIIEGRVSHRANLCARTMREALGWGLGDAHAWARRLPHMDYAVRSDGLARPGDILVWPFTYGPGRAEHIGIAVRQGRRLMLLSNLGGRLGTSEILGGYLAFHHPGEGPNTG